MKKVDFLILLFFVFLAVITRLYKINSPLADYHSWRQVDTAAVGRNFARNDFNLLYPKYDDLSSIESGLENPEGYRFVEFPLYNAIFAAAYKLSPTLPIEVYGRLTTVFFSIITLMIIYYLGLKESGRITAIFASLSYSILPYFVFFSRVILPETTALAFVFLSIFFLYLWSRRQPIINNQLLATSYYLLSIVFLSLSLLVKPTVVFYVIALIYLFWKKFGFSFLKKLSFYLFFIISVIPFFLWRYHISFYPQGIPASSWLITQVNTFEGQKNIFFKPAFFRWIFFERICQQMLGGYLVFLFILGIIIKPKKYFLHFLLISAFVYLFVFQGGNVQHEYYQTLIFPAVALFVGVGVEGLKKLSKNLINVFFLCFVVLVIYALSLFFAYYRVRDFYNIPEDLIKIAQAIKTLTQKEDKIITDRLGDTTLLYLADRRGSPANYKSLEEFKLMDYKYFVTSNRDTIAELLQENKFIIIFDNNQFAIFKL